MQRRRRFEDPRSECVWAAIETLGAAHQREVLRELATVQALSLENPRTTADKLRAAVNALREVAEILGHSPSVKEYRALRKELPELGIPSDPNVRRWLGAGWNDCLKRVLLDAVGDGDFASRPIGFTDRFDDDEVLAALRECVDELGHPPTVTEYLGWARRPDVRDRFGRRPSSIAPFERFGNFRGALTAAGVIGGNEARYTANSRISPLRFAYSDNDISAALRKVARRLRRSPRPAEYQQERQRISEEALANGEMRNMTGAAGKYYVAAELSGRERPPPSIGSRNGRNWIALNATVASYGKYTAALLPPVRLLAPDHGQLRRVARAPAKRGRFEQTHDPTGVGEGKREAG